MPGKVADRCIWQSPLPLSRLCLDAGLWVRFVAVDEESYAAVADQVRRGSYVPEVREKGGGHAA